MQEGKTTLKRGVLPGCPDVENELQKRAAAKVKVSVKIEVPATFQGEIEMPREDFEKLQESMDVDDLLFFLDPDTFDFQTYLASVQTFEETK